MQYEIQKCILFRLCLVLSMRFININHPVIPSYKRSIIKCNMRIINVNYFLIGKAKLGPKISSPLVTIRVSDLHLFADPDPDPGGIRG